MSPTAALILNTGLDRPLGLAGVALVRRTTPCAGAPRLVAWDEPLAIIPNVAIHLNREVTGRSTKPNADMLLLCRTVQDAWRKGLSRGQAGRAPRRGGGDEPCPLSCAPTATSSVQLVGFEQDLLGPLDNLTSVHARLRGLLDAAA